MLVLTRSKDESIWIGDSKVTVVKISDTKVRLGVDAASDVKILREELREQPASQDGIALTHEGNVTIDCCGSVVHG